MLNMHMLKSFINHGLIYIPEGDAIILVKGAALEWLEERGPEYSIEGEDLGLETVNEGIARAPVALFEALLGTTKFVEFEKYLQQYGNRNVEPPSPIQRGGMWN